MGFRVQGLGGSQVIQAHTGTWGQEPKARGFRVWGFWYTTYTTSGKSGKVDVDIQLSQYGPHSNTSLVMGDSKKTSDFRKAHIDHRRLNLKVV